MSGLDPTFSGPIGGSNDPFIGTVIAEKYEIHSLIAKGGMGRVYEASQLPLGRRVAVKILDQDQASPGMASDYKQRFLREAGTYARLVHANTVTMFDYGELDDENNTLFIVMERVRGETLKEIIRRGPVPAARALRIVYCIAMSLREAHTMGVVHRDLKPSNVMVDLHPEGRDVIKVLDFGLAKRIDPDASGSLASNELNDGYNGGPTLSKHGVMIGSPGYMSPEQIEGEKIDRRVDFYGVGVIAFEMLTGQPPFRGNNAISTMVAHVNAEVPSFYEANSEVILPDEVEEVVRRCLEKSPNDRFQNADQLLAAIRAAIPPGGLGEDLGFTDSDLSMPIRQPAAAPSQPAIATTRASMLPFVAVVGVVMALVLAVLLIPRATQTQPVVVEVPAPEVPVLSLTSEPSGAEVWEGNRNHGVTPLPLELPIGVAREFELRLHGYLPVAMQVDAGEEDLKRHVHLRVVPVEEPTPTPPPDPSPSPRTEPIFIER